MDIRGYYATLGVSQDANFQEIKKSYRRLARKYHPDRNKSPTAEETIRKINAAFEILSDRKKRKKFDSDEPSNEVNNEILSSGNRLNPNNFTNHHQSHTNLGHDSLLLDTIRSRFSILIEPSLWLAFGGCETIAPKVFVVDKSKHINPKARVQSESADTLDRIVMAAQACPTKAIKIIDRYTGNQIFP